MDRIKHDISKVKQKYEHPDKNVSQEFQTYGVNLAAALEDTKYKSLYIKLAKEEPRELLEQALSFVQDYPSPQSKGKLFMYKLKEIKAQRSKGS